jgi:hypothetical protein
MALPEDLLEQAQHLAQREPKRPKQASLRRAVSTAYYALFHLLITETVRNWKRARERNTLARMFDHGPMRKACDKTCSGLNAYFNTNPPPGQQLMTARHLHLVADTFLRMQQDRHSADYDSSKKWSRTDVIAKVDSVAFAFQTWKIIRKDASAQDFLVTLLLKER